MSRFERRQDMVHQQLDRRKLPGYFSDLFAGEPRRVYAFLRALNTNTKNRGWIVGQVVPKLATQVRSLSSDKLREILDYGLELLIRQDIGVDTYLIPFKCCNPRQAAEVYNLLLDSILSERFFLDKKEGAPGLVTLALLTMFEENCSWKELLKGVCQGEEGCVRAFTRLLGLLVQMSGFFPEIIPVESGWSRACFDYNSFDPSQVAAFVYGKHGERKGSLPVFSQYSKACEKVLSEAESTLNASSARLVAMAQKLDIADIFVNAERIWRELRHPRCWLRTEGDLIKIGDPALIEIGLRYIRLFPEENFPSIKVWLYVQLPLCAGYLIFEDFLSPPNLFGREEGLYSENSSGIEVTITAIRRYTVLTALHRICLDQFQRSSGGNGSTGDSGEDRADSGNHIGPRPHLRRLPDGYQASEWAVGRSPYAVPPGYTYVVGTGQLFGTNLPDYSFEHPLFVLKGVV